jgi:hypothetical protein
MNHTPYGYAGSDAATGSDRGPKPRQLNASSLCRRRSFFGVGASRFCHVIHQCGSCRMGAGLYGKGPYNYELWCLRRS